ncbi:DUF1127 domain-containing protein [Rubellimicrobium rubrum]|uniref:DUF1127 domain-containing protein n=1 Tax=Rubellimicrobium rubrum TaxID=2585369 RepID=A0A5C4N153_9RHOB|nr:DUF1127 domain-containing protein [Rubellimicrobium rubrum]TNC50533.1 DUF1127 domain-containing protein [Rubellimicrobium rubrum]
MSDVVSFSRRSPEERAVSALRFQPASLVRWWAARQDKRRSSRQLRDLPPYLLDDIGLLQATEHLERR